MVESKLNKWMSQELLFQLSPSKGAALQPLNARHHVWCARVLAQDIKIQTCPSSLPLSFKVPSAPHPPPLICNSCSPFPTPRSTGILVLDEADQLLAPQFSQDVGRLADHVGRGLAAGRQTVLVSATLNPTNLALAATWCRDPVPLLTGQGRTQVPEDDVIGESSSDVGHREATASPAPGWGWGRRAAAASPGSSAGGVGTGLGAPAPVLPPGLVHLVAGTAPHHAADTLRRGIHALDAQRALVFMNFQDRLRDVQGKLEARGMPAASLHGELSKQERQATLAAFTAGRFRALLVSDVAARGLDIPDCDAVFNLELPTDASHYAHRAGRTAR